MPGFGSTALKLVQTGLYALQFCLSAFILGIYSYFLAVLSSNNLPIKSWKKAVTGISGAAVVYLGFAVILTCFLGGMRVFATLAMVLNIAFFIGFIVIAVLARDGASSCTGVVKTPLGDGSSKSGQNLFEVDGQDNSNVQNYKPDLGFACRMNRAAFIVAIAGALIFLLLTGLQLMLARKHKSDKQFQAAPGAKKRRFWHKKPRNDHPGTVESAHHSAYTQDTKPDPTTYDPHYSASGTNYSGSTAMPGGHGHSSSSPYATGPPGPYTNY